MENTYISTTDLEISVWLKPEELIDYNPYAHD